LIYGAKALFSLLVAYSRYISVYGALVVISLFLMWVYLRWVIILIGAELMRSLKTFCADRCSNKRSNLPAIHCLTLTGSK
tara:strand:- start:10500 stop:10739 length:240 start_codon:yes stop_codon:yes gene_type:complete